MSTTNAPSSNEPEVLFESHGGLRKYKLNRDSKLNALNVTMLNTLRPQIEAWSKSDLCGTVVGTGAGRAFCAGGDVAGVVLDAQKEETRPRAINFFKREFEMDYILATMSKPYVVIMDGITMGGGVGLAANAPFRIATENTLFAMPETKIGYCPDVGASFFLSRMDGQLGTYLALTAATLRGRHVFEHGIATHYVPSSRIPQLLENLSTLDNPTHDVIDSTIEELYQERQSDEAPLEFVGAKRVALDDAFKHNEAESIIQHLQYLVDNTGNDAIKAFAERTVQELQARSPTSLKVALEAIRRGRDMNLKMCFDMELRIATAFCSGASPDFHTGVTAVLINKPVKGVPSARPAWSPSTLEEVDKKTIIRNFFSADSPFASNAPTISVSEPSAGGPKDPGRYALPSEHVIGTAVTGSGVGSGGTGLTLEELVVHFERGRPGKHGIREKVIEVVERRCEVTDNADKNYRWLKWRH